MGRKKSRVTPKTMCLNLAMLQTTWRPGAPPTVCAFTEATGPSHTVPENAKPLDYFFLFLPQSFFCLLLLLSQLPKRPTGMPTKISQLVAHLIPPCGEKNYSGRNACLPVGEATATPDPRFTDPWISNVMPKTRFFKLNQYCFHLRNTADAPGRDSPLCDTLFKVRPFLDLILPQFKAHFQAGRDLSIDEAMIGFERRIFFKQHMPAKPTKWGHQSVGDVRCCHWLLCHL